MKKLLIVGLAVIGLSACKCANAAYIEIEDVWHTYTNVINETPYSALNDGIGNSGNLEYEYINTLFGTSFSALNQIGLKISNGNNEGEHTDDYYRDFQTNTFEIAFNSTPGPNNPLTESIDCIYGCYLAVKDGNHPVRPYYFYDISSWNGVDTINGSDFWRDERGSISHVSIWQGYEVAVKDKPPGNVPEPSVIALIGLGLLGFTFKKRLTSISSVVK